MKKTETKIEKKLIQRSSSAEGLAGQQAGSTEMGNIPGVRAGGQGEGRSDGVRNQGRRNFSWSKRWGKEVWDEEASQLGMGRINICTLASRLLRQATSHATRDSPEFYLTSPNQLLGARHGGSCRTEVQGRLPTHWKAVQLSSMVAKDLEALDICCFTRYVDCSFSIGPAVDCSFVIEQDRKTLQMPIHDSQMKPSCPGYF